ncbi:MAG TPA: glycoside hydrolase family 9 protein [Flavisolibacter sp.]|nr:glycoside hydrolase family 9 protein [Flavisolibacter sp.]
MRKRILVLVIFILPFLNCFSQNSTSINLNQIGFYPGKEKIAIITGDPSLDKFFILGINQKDTFYSGNLEAAVQSKNSSLITRKADFSNFKREGKYILLFNTAKSYPFEIKSHIHHKLSTGVLKGYYFQRTAIPLENKYAGKWARKEGHPDSAVLIHGSAASELRKEGTVINEAGGWYDAGDYNKYIVNSGITMGTLFSAYEDMPGYFKRLDIAIPESGNGIPDILNEAVFNLRWMLRMQDPMDGGVYHKCTNASFDAMIMPDKATKPRYVVAKSTAASLDFAAVTAQAARIFKSFQKLLPGLSDSCVKAAEKAWDWASKNENVVYSQQILNAKYKPAITTGEYGDRQFEDEFFWAASELFATTYKKIYEEIVIKKITVKPVLPTWSNVTLLGYYSLIRNAKHLPKDFQQTISTMKTAVIAFANDYVSSVSSSAFHVVMGGSKSDFVWGSNSVAANQGVLLINAYLISNNKTYLQAALSNLDYILGRNATGYCFVTGFGSKSVMHPHHRPSIADGIDDPVPGLLAGGPNPGQQDKCHYDFHEPETSYVDSDCAYASNEIAINWNAPLVYLVAAIENFSE